MVKRANEIRQFLSSPFALTPSDAPSPAGALAGAGAGTMIGVEGGVKTLFAAAASAAEGPVPVVSNLFRTGIFTRCDSTKSTPSAVSVKSELSARVIYPLFRRYHAVNSK